MTAIRFTCPRCNGAGRLHPPDPIGDEAGEPCPRCREDGYNTLIEVTHLSSDIDGSVYFTTEDGEHHGERDAVGLWFERN